MKNVLIAFVAGLVVGTVGVQAAGRLVWLMRSPPDEAEAIMRGVSPEELEKEQFREAERPMNGLSLIAGVICATLCAVRTCRQLAADPAPLRPDVYVPLTDAEFERAYQCSSWLKLAEHRTDFVRGFLVGALAPSDPALAAKIDDLGSDAVAGLRRRLIHRQERLG